MGRNFVDWLRTQRMAPGRGKLPEAFEVPEVLRGGEIFCVFQPLVDLTTGEVFAYESLLRSTSPVYKNPVDLFEQAVRTRCCGALGRLARELSVEGCGTWPLFLNIHPNEFDEGWLVRPDDPVFAHEQPVHLEITESVPLSHFHHCRNVLGEVRSKGVFLAVDDLGAGYSNLQYIADLCPEVVKLDRELITGLQNAPRRQKVVRALVSLCEDLNARVVAEGLEEPEEVDAVRRAGVHYGQGYIFSPPEAVPPRGNYVLTVTRDGREFSRRSGTKTQRPSR